MPHTILIDGSFLTHRAYHTPIAEMTNGAGVAVTALFSYTRSMLKMLQDPHFRADYIGVFVDSGPSFRKQLYGEYKAHRSAPSAELRKQFPLVADATRALGIETIKAEGMEADDLIACYAKVAQAQGHRVTIISRDKDLMQLVGPTVKLYDPVGKKTFDEAEVRKKFQVEPRQVRDVLALMGDDGDNVPGVPGIGPKTAAALISEFNSVEELLANTAKITNKKRRQLIEEHVDTIRRALALVELRHDIPMPVLLEDLQRQPINRDKFLAFLREHSFGSIISKLDKICPPTAAEQAAEAAPRTSSTRGRPRLDNPTQEAVQAPPAPLSVAVALKRPKVEIEGVTIVDTPEEARRVLRILRSPGVRERYHACDTEAIKIEVKHQSPYNYGEVICASVYCGPDVDFGTGPNLWIDNMDDARGVLDLFKEYFEDEGIKKVWHNYSFDRAMMWRHGIDVKGFGGDTIHMARLWDAARTSVGKKYSLEALTGELLEGETKRSIKEIFGRNKVLKDGTLGKEIVVPNLDAIQRHAHSPPRLERRRVRRET